MDFAITLLRDFLYFPVNRKFSQIWITWYTNGF